MTTILAIDPGSSGGICIADHDGIDCWPMPKTERDVWNLLQTQLRTADVEPWHAFIEDVHAMPQQGVSSTFKFGVSYGFLRGLLVASRIPFAEVRPRTWQKALGIAPARASAAKTQSERGKLQREHKNRLKAKAQQMYPDLRITLATADAVLLAHYGELVLGGCKAPRAQVV